MQAAGESLRHQRCTTGEWTELSVPDELLYFDGEDFRGARDAIHDIRADHGLEVAVVEGAAHTLPERLHLGSVGQQLTCRGGSAHADAGNDDLLFADVVGVDAGNDRVVARDGRDGCLQVQRPTGGFAGLWCP